MSVKTCLHGHQFAALPSHPQWDGKPLCPFCMTGLLRESRENTAKAVDHAAKGWSRAADRLQQLALMKSAARRLVRAVEERDEDLSGMVVKDAIETVKERLNV